MRTQCLTLIVHFIVMATKSYLFYVDRHDCRIVLDKLKYIYNGYWPEVYGNDDDKPYEHARDKLQFLDVALYKKDDGDDLVLGFLQFRRRMNIKRAREYFNGALGIYKIRLFNIRKPLTRQLLRMMMIKKRNESCRLETFKRGSFEMGGRANTYERVISIYWSRYVLEDGDVNNDEYRLHCHWLDEFEKDIRNKDISTQCSYLEE